MNTNSVPSQGVEAAARNKKDNSVRIKSTTTVTRVAASVLLTAATLALTSCGGKNPFPQDAFAPEGPSARAVYAISWPVFIVAGVVGVLVYAALAVILVRFRRKNEDEVPKQVHGNMILEMTWTGIPAVVLIVIAIFSVSSIFKLAEIPEDRYEVTVVGHQWWWEFHYPVQGQDILGTYLAKKALDPNDAELAKTENREQKLIANYITEKTPVVVNAGEMHIPAGRNIRLNLASQDVAHSFWVPRLAGKIDAIPGRINHLNIDTDANDAGKIIYGQCAEFCGTAHADMRFKVVVDSPKDFAAWIQAQSGPMAKSTGDVKTDLVAQGQEIFQTSGACTTCHQTDPSKQNDFGIVGKIGPNLAHVASRKTFAGATLSFNKANLKAWINDPQGLKPNTRMVVRKFNQNELDALSSYLLTLK